MAGPGLTNDIGEQAESWSIGLRAALRFPWAGRHGRLDFAPGTFHCYTYSVAR